MSGIWPFFNSSFSNASINKILVEIDNDQQQREALRRQQLKKEAATKSKPQPSSPELANKSDASTASLPHEVAYTPASQQFNVTASQLLHSIKENDTLARKDPQQDTSNKSDTLKSATADESTATWATFPGTELPEPAITIAKPALGSGSPGSNVVATPLSPSTTTEESAQHPNVNMVLFNRLLDQPNLRDEINLAKNQRLINYISQVDVVDVLIDYILISLTLSRSTELTPDQLHNDIFIDSEDSEDSSVVAVSTSGAAAAVAAANGMTSTEDQEPLTPMDKALQRASVCSEIMILPNTSILTNLMSSQPLMTKLWRGFFDRDVKDFFHHARLITPDTLAEEEAEDSEKSEQPVTDTSDTPEASDPIPSEEEYERSRYKDSHALLLLNNFLKLVDDMAMMNMNELMNFLRFEQEHCTLTTQFIRFIPYSLTTCDLLVRLVSTDKPYNSNGLIDMLIDQNLVVKLFKMAKMFYLDHQVQDNICNLLNGVVGISSNVGFWDDPSMASAQQLNEFGEPATDEQGNVMRNSNPNVGPNDLTRQLVSHQCVLEMLDIIVNYGNYGLVTVVSVIIEVIRKNNSDYDEFDWIGAASEIEDESNVTEPKHLPSARDPIYLGVMLKLFSLHLSDIVDSYLTDKYFTIRKVELLATANGDSIEPLGYERFKVMELLAELLHCSNMILMNKSIKFDYLIYKHDLLRDVRQTENLVKDALNDDIKQQPDEDLVKDIDKLSITSSQAHEEYVDIESDLSIGNFFKMQLLETHSIPLIALKMHKFPWNNFMHNVVFDLAQQIFNGRLANWDEDQASNQEETKYDDNLSLNKTLIWSLFGDFSNFNEEYSYNDHAGFFNLPAYILYCFHLSEQKEADTNFKLGYMGHLTLIAEEVHKFQNYVENFGMARDDQTFSLLKEESDSSLPFYLKSSFFVFNTLYERLFESGKFDKWNEFVNTELKELNSMYNKVLGNPNDIGPGEDPEDNDVMISEDGIPISQPPVNKDAIILDNGDSEEFRQGVEVLEGEEVGGNDEDDNNDNDNDEDSSDEEFGGGGLRPVKCSRNNNDNEPNDGYERAIDAMSDK